MSRLTEWLRRRWLLLVVIAGFAVLVITQLNSLRTLGATFVLGLPQWLLAAVLLQGVYYLVYSFLYKFAFLTVEVISRVLDIIPVLFASIFLKAIVPSGGVSALAVFIDDACRRGQSGARVAEGSLLVLVSDLATMIILIVFGLAYLASRGVLQVYQWLAALFYGVFVVGLSLLLLLGRFQPVRLGRLLKIAQHGLNQLATRLRRAPFVAPDWAERTSCDFVSAACDIASHPVRLGYTLVTALTVHLINVACLYTVSVAYHQPLSIGALVAGFSMDVVFSVITFIPHGIGIVEGVMALVFVSLGVPTDRAIVITLVFRGLNVWLPLLIGFFFLQRVRSFGGGPSAGEACERRPAPGEQPPGKTE